MSTRKAKSEYTQKHLIPLPSTYHSPSVQSPDRNENKINNVLLNVSFRTKGKIIINVLLIIFYDMNEYFILPKN